MLLRIAAASLLALVVACGSNAIDIRPAAPDPLIAAVDAFVSAGRSPEAYAELAATAAVVPASPRTEARLLVLALASVQAVQARPVAAQVEALALTVWPTLLGTAAAEPGETAASYLLRLCSGALAEACHRVVLELQSAVVRAIAMHHAATRVRSAVAACLPCASEPAWIASRCCASSAAPARPSRCTSTRARRSRSSARSRRCASRRLPPRRHHSARAGVPVGAPELLADGCDFAAGGRLARARAARRRRARRHRAGRVAIRSARNPHRRGRSPRARRRSRCGRASSSDTIDDKERAKFV